MLAQPPDNIIDIFLQPGDHYFGDSNTRIRTLLGSCVSLVMWHPKLLVGGMCHYMLPTRARRGTKLNGKYADEAIQIMMNEARHLGTSPKEYQIKLFGGGNMFPNAKKQLEKHIGLRNVEAGRALLKQHKVSINVEDLGGDCYRNLFFEVWSGDVWVQHRKPTRVVRPAKSENREVKSRKICQISA